MEQENPQNRQESDAEKQRDTMLVAVLRGEPSEKIEKVLKDWQPGLKIRWVDCNDIPQTPPDDVQCLVINAGDRPDKEAYDSQGVLVNRLMWNRDGSWAGWSDD